MKAKSKKPAGGFKEIQKFSAVKDCVSTLTTVRKDYEEFQMRVFTTITTGKDGTADLKVYEVFNNTAEG